MLIPTMITLTGPDDRTDISALASFAASRPEVEIAVLFSASRRGISRYPTLGWVAELADSGMNLSAHVCGSWAQAIVDGRDPDFDPALLAPFSRVQVNTRPGADPAAVRAWADRTAGRDGKPLAPILQSRGDEFPEDDRVLWLHDPSGGRGIAQTRWPRPRPGTGLAGGLGPGRIAPLLASLEHVDGVWIDMETSLRNAADEFDLGICEEVCREVDGVRCPAMNSLSA